jgi:dihydrolipoyl dehydrogenase
MDGDIKNRRCQVLVIGSGPAGYVAAIRLAQLKKDVLLVEKNAALGGVCLIEGCIPSKAFIHAADLMGEAREAARMGVHVEGIALDMRGLVQWKDQIVKKLTDGVRFLVQKSGAEILRGTARFLSNRTAAVFQEGTRTDVEFETAVIATGASNKELPGFPLDGERVIDSAAAFSLDRVPRSLAVVGAGYIGLELGTMFRKFGAEVTLIEPEPTLLPSLDWHVGETLASRLGELGVVLHLGSFAESFQAGDPSLVTIRDAQGQKRTIEAEKVLLCIGRRPLTSGLDLEKAGVTTNPRGFIDVDARLETNIPGIFAIGDVARDPMLAHKAYREAKLVAALIAGEPAPVGEVVIPAAIYTDPEVAWAGLTGKEAQEKGLDVVSGTFPFRVSGRALTLNAPEGFVKTLADAKTGLIRGVTVIGHNASEVISEAALALEMRASLKDLHGAVAPHPTLSEALIESIDAALGQAIHIVNRRQSLP